MLDDAAIFLPGARKEAGDVHQRQDRNFEGVAEPYETGGLAARVDIQTAGQHHRLVGDDADRPPLQPDKAGDDVLGEVFLNLEKVMLIRDLQDQLLHIVGRVRIVGDERVEAFLDPVHIVEERADRGFFAVGERQEVNEAPDLLQRLHIVLIGAVGDGGFAGVGGGAAKLLRRHDFIRHGFHDIGAGDEHVG